MNPKSKPDNINTSVGDQGSGDLLTPGSGIGDVKKSESGMNIPDHISESLETIFGFIGSGIRDGKIWIRIRDNHPGSATLINTVRYPVNVTK